MLFILATSLLTVIISKKICEYLFPDTMDFIYINICLFGMKLYANTHIFLTNMSSFFNKFKQTNKTNSILFIKNGQEVKECTLEQFKLNIHSFDNYDLILYKTENMFNDKYKYNVLRLDKRKFNVTNCHLKDLIIISKANFIDIQVLYNNQMYNIEFGEDNYYIHGNIILDRAFITWFLYKSYGVLIEENSEYICNIIDQDVNFISLSDYKYISICNNNSSIHENKKIENINIENNESKDK